MGDFQIFHLILSAHCGKLREVNFPLLFTVKVRLNHTERRLCSLNMSSVALVVRKTGKTG